MIDAAKVSDADLLARLMVCPTPGTAWKHYKTGATYVIICRAIHEATQQPLVVYQPVGGRVVFARPLAEWAEPVDWQGRTVPRFVRAT